MASEHRKWKVPYALKMLAVLPLFFLLFMLIPVILPIYLGYKIYRLIYPEQPTSTPIELKEIPTRTSTAKHILNRKIKKQLEYTIESRKKRQAPDNLTKKLLSQLHLFKRQKTINTLGDHTNERTAKQRVRFKSRKA